MCAAASCRGRAARGLLEKTQPPVRSIPTHAAVPRRARPASRTAGIHPGARAQQLPAAGGRHVDYLRERCRRPFYTYARSRSPPRTSRVPHGRNPSRCTCAAASCRRRAARGLPDIIQSPPGADFSPFVYIFCMEVPRRRLFRARFYQTETCAYPCENAPGVMFYLG